MAPKKQKKNEDADGSNNNNNDDSKNSVNGTAIIAGDNAKALANYPHARKYGDLIFVSGISSRRLDNTYEGVIENPDGTLTLDIRKQTRAVLENIKEILKVAGATMEHIIDCTVFLVKMEDYGGMNEVYNEYFNATIGPSRTTVAVHQLPSPKLLVEIKVVAAAPK